MNWILNEMVAEGGEHAKRFPPSGAPIWGNCSGSVNASANYPNFDTPETLEGTAAHWVGSECLVKLKAGASRSDTLCGDWIGQTAPNGVVVDEEIADGAQVYVNVIADICDKYAEHNAWSRLLIEFRVSMPDIHEGNWGTLDCSLWIPEVGMLWVWDYKHGHRNNSPVENLQLIDYTQGVINHHRIDGYVAQHVALTLSIIQPFCYSSTGPLKSWELMLSDIRPWVNQLHQKACEADTNPKLTAGKWCRDCPAVGECSAAREYVYWLKEYSNLPYQMDEMSGHDLAIERDIIKSAVKVAEARLAAIEDQLTQNIKNGATDTGLALEAPPGRIKWLCDDKQAIAHAKLFGADISKTKAATPTQAIQAVPKENRAAYKEAQKKIAQRATGSLTLIPASESIAARAFQTK